MASIQFKRGTAARWDELNLVLEAGQPGFVMDENRLKIGDGVTAWRDLPYLGESNVINEQTHYDFPSIGRDNVIYKAESEKLLYQWNSADLKYEVVGAVEISGDLSDIRVIHGGGATNND
jgi:hypothetical protein